MSDKEIRLTEDGQQLEGPGIEKKHNARKVTPLKNGGVLVAVHDLIDSDTGQSFREMNLEKTHAIPLGTLVEIQSGSNEEDCEWGNGDGARLFVISHSRDCDGTPLYNMVHRLQDSGGTSSKQSLLNRMSKPVINGYSGDSLKIIAAPPTEMEACDECGFVKPIGTSCEWCEYHAEI